nr:sulfatase-like hydrolase/transferase [Cohnella thailandensis]
MVYCDDLGYGDLGCYGSDAIRTPHLDRLAEEGARFTDWYSNSPVCSPSRASLLTGRYPARTGIERILTGKRGSAGLPSDVPTISSVLKSHGYRTGLFGKWHLGTHPDNAPSAHGFDEAFGFLAGCVDYYSHIFYWEQAGGVNPVHDLWHNGREVWRNGEYLTDLITDRTIEFIEASRNEPFFAYVAYNAPHYPMHAPQRYLDRYPELPADRRIMAAMISAVDDGVGAIADALKRKGCYEDTIFFFSSDNGPSTESRNYLDGNEDKYYGGSAGLFRGHKASLFEGGIREPAIWSYPAAVQAGQVRREPCMMADVLPTILDLADLPPLSSVDGDSVSSLLRGGEGMARERLFWSYGDQAAVREGDWKLVLNGRIDFTETAPDAVHLSDLGSDPSERVNLKDEYPEITERLRRAVREWLEKTKNEGNI